MRYLDKSIEELHELLKSKTINIIKTIIIMITTVLTYIAYGYGASIVVSLIALPFMLMSAEEVPQDVDIYDL